MFGSRSLFTLLFDHFLPSLFVNSDGQGQTFTDFEISHVTALALGEGALGTRYTGEGPRFRLLMKEDSDVA